VPLLIACTDIFIESKCDDEKIIMHNILDVKTTSPDYIGYVCYGGDGPAANKLYRQDPEKAAQDFRDRIKNYEKVYETIDETEKHYTYVKIENVG
jgi:6-phosphofructo-2-kinase / fructose-2,6-biphosphatase 2